jgi:alanyl-tRNA synthetase
LLVEQGNIGGDMRRAFGAGQVFELDLRATQPFPIGMGAGQDRIKAGDVMRDVAGRLGGKGGGRPDMAQGGGNDVAALPGLISAFPQWVADQLTP